MQNGYAQSPRSSWGAQKLFGLEEGRQEVGLRRLREETPGREIRQPPAGLETRAQPETQPGFPPQRDIARSGLGPPPGTWQSPGSQPGGASCKHTEKWKRLGPHKRQDYRQGDFPRASFGPPACSASPDSTDQGRVTKRSERRLLCLCGLIHIPFPGSGWHLWSPLTLGVCSVPFCLITVRTLASPLASLGPLFPPLQKKELAEVVSRTL